MASLVVENEVEVPSVESIDSEIANLVTTEFFASDEALEELGVWLSGLQSFLRSPTPVKGDEAITEFQVARSALQRCILLNARIISEATLGTAELPPGLALDDLRGLAYLLRETALAADGIVRAGSLRPAEWQAWADMLCSRLAASSVLRQIVRNAELAGERFLPDQLLAVIHGKAKFKTDVTELAHVLPRFGKVLKWLSIIGMMLEQDEPMKASLVIFEAVNEQVGELTRFIDSRVAGLNSEEAELVASLDAAAYTSSIELKKVYSQELSGLSEIRNAPAVFARMETAYSLLTEGFQHILAGFAKLIDGRSDVFALFPNFHIKLERSIVLRRELWRVAEIVRAAEATPEREVVDTMGASLREFAAGPVRYLFYKDTETVERFIEEILLTRQNKDLVPLLHRFSAYLDTLFGQVCLRAVLADHPFEIAQ